MSGNADYDGESECRNCGETIHQEPSPPPFSPTWVHEDGAVTCHIEWAHPTLPPMDNAITAVRIAQPHKGSDRGTYV